MSDPQELDARTVRLAQRGDRAARERFLRRYAGPMHALVRRSGAPGEADDLTQELLARLLEVLPRFSLDGPALLTTWVFVVAQRWLIDVCRRPRPRLVPPGTATIVRLGARRPASAGREAQADGVLPGHRQVAPAPRPRRHGQTLTQVPFRQAAVIRYSWPGVATGPPTSQVVGLLAQVQMGLQQT